MTRADPEVSRIKFEREVGILTDQRDVLQSRGIFILGESTFPIVELMFVPRRPLKFAMAVQQQGLIALSQPSMALVDVPSIAGRAFKARFDLTDYDLRAPSLEFRDPWTDELLSYATMLRAVEYEKERQAHNVLLDDHPTTHKPFLCLRGVREYHEHPQHSGDDWLLYRTEMSLFSIAMSLWRVTLDLTQPMLLLKQTGLEVQWVSEAKA